MGQSRGQCTLGGVEGGREADPAADLPPCLFAVLACLIRDLLLNLTLS